MAAMIVVVVVESKVSCKAKHRKQEGELLHTVTADEALLPQLSIPLSERGYVDGMVDPFERFKVHVHESIAAASLWEQLQQRLCTRNTRI